MNLKQHLFVTEYLRFGDPVIAYHNAYKCYNSSYRTKESSANRLLKNPEIAEAIRDAQERIRSEAEQELKAQLKQELLSVQRKREILARIAEGDVYVEQQYRGKDCRTCTQMVRPTINHMLKAIDIDSKLAGDYTNKKQLTVVHTLKPTQAATVQPENANNATVDEKQQASEHSIEQSSANCNKSQQIDDLVFEPGTEQLHISQSGLRNILSAPARKQKEMQLE